MTNVISRAKSLGQRLHTRLFKYLPNRRGNVAAVVALSLPVLAGVMGLAAEGSNWFLSFRSQQNAADSAVVAAANQALGDYYSNNDVWKVASTDPYTYEGHAVAKSYGYVDGGNATVTVNTATCPTGFSNPSGFDCFQVTISKIVPLYLTRLVGFHGNATGGQNIIATAYSGAVQVPAPVCFTTLNTDNKAFNVDGKSADFAGCPVGTNGGGWCSGGSTSTLTMPYFVAADGSTDKNGHCSTSDEFLTPPITDPYVSLDTSIPTASACGGSSLTGSSATTSLNSSAANGSTSCPLVHIITGDLTLTANVNVTGDQIWVIKDGVLNLNGFTLETGGGAPGGSGGLAVVFTDASLSGSTPSSVGSTGYVQGAGTLNISGMPANSGTFSGVTLYQDPRPWGGEPPASSSKTYNATFDGNSSGQTWDLSGIVYFPNAQYTLNGAMDKASSGYNCFNMVVADMGVHGGGSFSLFSTPLEQCGLQGSKTVQTFGYRFALVG